MLRRAGRVGATFSSCPTGLVPVVSASATASGDLLRLSFRAGGAGVPSLGDCGWPGGPTPSPASSRGRCNSGTAGLVPSVVSASPSASGDFLRLSFRTGGAGVCGCADCDMAFRRLSLTTPLTPPKKEGRGEEERPVGVVKILPRPLTRSVRAQTARCKAATRSPSSEG